MSNDLPYDFDPLGPDPDWNAGGHVHNWRNHVGERAKGIWATLTPSQREAIAIDADALASSEHWE